MATVIEELSLCDCCAMVVANGDESGCRDYYGHTHEPCSVPFHTVMDGDPVMSPRGFTCDGCGDDQGAYANEWPAVVLAGARRPAVTTETETVATWHRTYQRGLITLGELAEELARLDRRYGPQPVTREALENQRAHGCGTFTDHPRVPGRQIVCTRHDAGMHVAEAIAPNGPPNVVHRWPL